MPKHIDRNMTVKEVLDQYPETARVFKKYNLLIVGKSCGPHEPMAFFTKAHGVEYDQFAAELETDRGFYRKRNGLRPHGTVSTDDPCPEEGRICKDYQPHAPKNPGESDHCQEGMRGTEGGFQCLKAEDQNGHGKVIIT